MINKIRKTLTLTQNSYSYSKGFTLIELLVVIAIIGILATVITVAVSSARKKARDARRLSDMKAIQTALEMYANDHGEYPPITHGGPDCSWDSGSTDSGSNDFINKLVEKGYLPKVSTDPTHGGCSGYRYYRYNCTTGGGGYPCYGCKQPYYVLGVVDMETSDRPYPDSPGWQCGTRNWQNEFDWVTGSFEK